jgi:hypothetical protein
MLLMVTLRPSNTIRVGVVVAFSVPPVGVWVSEGVVVVVVVSVGDGGGSRVIVVGDALLVPVTVVFFSIDGAIDGTALVVVGVVVLFLTTVVFDDGVGDGWGCCCAVTVILNNKDGTRKYAAIGTTSGSTAGSFFAIATITNGGVDVESVSTVCSCIRYHTVIMMMT